MGPTSPASAINYIPAAPAAPLGRSRRSRGLGSRPNFIHTGAMEGVADIVRERTDGHRMYHTLDRPRVGRRRSEGDET
jgi:hypothetical protein